MNKADYLKQIPESAILNNCLYYLRQKGYTVWRNNNGASKYKNKDGSYRTVRFGVKGQPDIAGFNHNGKFIFWECKRHGKKPTREQLEFINNALESGAIGGWGTDEDCFNYF